MKIDSLKDIEYIKGENELNFLERENNRFEKIDLSKNKLDFLDRHMNEFEKLPLVNSIKRTIDGKPANYKSNSEQPYSLDDNDKSWLKNLDENSYNQFIEESKDWTTNAHKEDFRSRVNNNFISNKMIEDNTGFEKFLSTFSAHGIDPTYLAFGVGANIIGKTAKSLNITKTALAPELIIDAGLNYLHSDETQRLAGYDNETEKWIDTAVGAGFSYSTSKIFSAIGKKGTDNMAFFGRYEKNELAKSGLQDIKDKSEINKHGVVNVATNKAMNFFKNQEMRLLGDAPTYTKNELMNSETAIDIVNKTSDIDIGKLKDYNTVKDEIDMLKLIEDEVHRTTFDNFNNLKNKGLTNEDIELELAKFNDPNFKHSDKDIQNIADIENKFYDDYADQYIKSGINKDTFNSNRFEIDNGKVIEQARYKNRTYDKKEITKMTDEEWNISTVKGLKKGYETKKKWINNKKNELGIELKKKYDDNLNKKLIKTTDKNEIKKIKSDLKKTWNKIDSIKKEINLNEDFKIERKMTEKSMLKYARTLKEEILSTNNIKKGLTKSNKNNKGKASHLKKSDRTYPFDIGEHKSLFKQNFKDRISNYALQANEDIAIGKVFGRQQIKQKNGSYKTVNDITSVEYRDKIKKELYDSGKLSDSEVLKGIETFDKYINMITGKNRIVTDPNGLDRAVKTAKDFKSMTIGLGYSAASFQEWATLIAHGGLKEVVKNPKFLIPLVKVKKIDISKYNNDELIAHNAGLISKDLSIGSEKYTGHENIQGFEDVLFVEQVMDIGAKWMLSHNDLANMTQKQWLTASILYKRNLKEGKFNTNELNYLGISNDKLKKIQNNINEKGELDIENMKKEGLYEDYLRGVRRHSKSIIVEGTDLEKPLYVSDRSNALMQFFTFLSTFTFSSYNKLIKGGWSRNKSNIYMMGAVNSLYLLGSEILEDQGMHQLGIRKSLKYDLSTDEGIMRALKSVKDKHSLLAMPNFVESKVGFFLPGYQSGNILNQTPAGGSITDPIDFFGDLTKGEFNEKKFLRATPLDDIPGFKNTVREIVTPKY